MEELKKKLAEWAGLKRVPRYGGTDMNNPLWLYPNGDHDNLCPNFPESLDACFKWLVPEALRMLAKKGYVPPIMKLFQLWYDELVSLTGDSSNVQQAAPALCLAIEKLIDKEKER